MSKRAANYDALRSPSFGAMPASTASGAEKAIADANPIRHRGEGRWVTLALAATRAPEVCKSKAHAVRQSDQERGCPLTNLRGVKTSAISHVPWVASSTSGKHPVSATAESSSPTAVIVIESSRMLFTVIKPLLVSPSGTVPKLTIVSSNTGDREHPARAARLPEANAARLEGLSARGSLSPWYEPLARSIIAATDQEADGR